MSKVEKAEALFKSGCNCSQAVFTAFADEFGLDEELAKRLSCGLGGGVGRMREVCGAVSGAAMTAVKGWEGDVVVSAADNGEAGKVKVSVVDGNGNTGGTMAPSVRADEPVEALGEVHRGVTLGFYAPAGYFGSQEARDEVDRIAAAGATWIVLTPNVWQEGRYTTVQFNDFMKSQSDLDVLDLCDYIHAKGLHVTLRPMLECFDGTDRMYIDFEDDVYRLNPRHGSAGNTYCSRWFASMKARTVHYAAVAERCRCEAFCIDSELDRMADYAFNAYWKDILSEVRKVYSGAVTSCHTRNRRHGVKWDECLPHKDFWLYDLDYLQISDYRRPVGDYEEREHSLEEMQKGFETEWLPYFRDLAKRYGKPIQFGEFGCTSSKAGARSPAVCSNLGYDGEEQANFLEAFMRVFSKEPWCRGYYWWNWERPFAEDARLRREKDGPSVSFCPYGKPVAEVFRRWYRK